MNLLAQRIERLQEAISPGKMHVVILLRYAEHGDDKVPHPGVYRVGRYAVAIPVGGTAAERKLAVSQLQRSGEYDTLPGALPAIPEEPHAIGEGDTRDPV